MMQIRSTRTPLIALTVLAAATASAGCSTAQRALDAPAVALSANTDALQTSGPDQFAQCLSDQGIPKPSGMPPAPPAGTQSPPPNMPSLNILPPPPGVDQQSWDKALQACASSAPVMPPQR